MRQSRITTYQDLEARIEFLENMVAEMNAYLASRRDAIDELRQFLIDEKEIII